MKEQLYKFTQNGINYYFKDKDRKIRHRTDGPAIESPEGGTWWQNNAMHRLDGPAVDFPTQKEWWVNDVRIARLTGNHYIGPVYLQALLDSTKR